MDALPESVEKPLALTWLKYESEGSRSLWLEAACPQSSLHPAVGEGSLQVARLVACFIFFKFPNRNFPESARAGPMQTTENRQHSASIMGLDFVQFARKLSASIRMGLKVFPIWRSLPM